MFLISMMKRQLLVLEDLIDDTMNCLKEYDNLQNKTLVVRRTNNDDPDYYEQEWNHGERNLCPLGKEDNKKVQAYKQRRYLREELKILKADKKAAEYFVEHFKDYSFDAIQNKLPKPYKCHSTRKAELENHGPVSSSYPDYSRLPEKITGDLRFKKIVAWVNEKYDRNPIPLPDKPNIARDGTPMRSKGECIWYDNILFEGLPVRVDPELLLKGISGQWHKLCPDFEFMCFDGSTIMVEHFGQWDDDKYAEKNKRKLQEYLDCGYVLGDNLIGTSDNAQHHTNELMILEALEKIKRRMFA